MPLFVFFAIFVAWLSYKIKKSNRIMSDNSQAFWENESKANSTRKQSLDNLDYIRFSKDCIPWMNDGLNDYTLSDYLLRLEKLIDAPIVNLTGITNTELKLTYGAPNLAYLSQCDENFTTLANLLTKYGQRLKDNGYEQEAVRVFEYAVSIHSDVRIVYEQLGNHYLLSGDKESFERLFLQASSLTGLNRDIIVNHLSELQNSSIHR